MAGYAMKRCSPYLYLAFAAIGLALAACGAGRQAEPTATASGEQPARAFAMGLSSLPAEQTSESYASAFELAASAGEVVLIQRVPPWQEMLTGEPSDGTVASTQRETELAEQFGLDLFVAIDPMDVVEGRSQLADLPEDLHGAGFAHEEVRRAFIAYAQYVAANYQPRYLALGVEVNSYEQRHPEDFEEFVVLYHEAYEAVKEISPDTLVFPTFQLEELQGLLPIDNPLPPQWYVIDRFEPHLDLLAVSSYPGLAFAKPQRIPAGYYTQLALHTARPIAIAGMGYSSEPGANTAADSAEEDQAAFLRWTLDGAQKLAMPLVIWFVGQDPAYTGDPPFDQLQQVGLKRQDGTRKLAWQVWETASRRPLAEASSEEPVGQ